MGSNTLKQFTEVLGRIAEDYGIRADQHCREAVRESHDAEKVIAAREALARHEVAEEIRELLTTHETVTTKRRVRAGNGRFAKQPRKAKPR